VNATSRKGANFVGIFTRSSGAFLTVFLCTGTVGADVIKQSSSGLCHPPFSPWYERTQSYTGFDSLDACLASDGRLPKGIASEPTATLSNDYERSKFGHGWADLDSDGQGSRAEALITLSTIPVTFAGVAEQRVVRGRWVSPFTGKAVFDAGDLDADHVVPLKYA